MWFDSVMVSPGGVEIGELEIGDWGVATKPERGSVSRIDTNYFWFIVGALAPFGLGARGTEVLTTNQKNLRSSAFICGKSLISNLQFSNLLHNLKQRSTTPPEHLGEEFLVGDGGADLELAGDGRFQVVGVLV